jgi:serine O-acetyltransferase
MSETGWIDALAKDVTGKLHTCNRCELRRTANNTEYFLPSRKEVHNVLDNLMAILFPGCHGHGTPIEDASEKCIFKELKSTVATLQKQAEMAFRYQCEIDECNDCDDCVDKAQAAAKFLLETLPATQEVLQDDIMAAYDGDPAAKSNMEVVMSYPAIQAISTFRIAHTLYEQDVPLIPRIMTELAHSRTGIDIHPGATIGKRFFIDHGTGVVIGETTTIGKNVKIYQGVTLGALSFPLDEDGNPVKGVKRHPDVQDNVTIYAEATILGGKTVIGEGSEIGGNVWLTKSVPPNSKVYNVQPDPKVLSR